MDGSGEIYGTVLVVDDEESVRESLTVLLEERYTVYTAKNGRDALARIGDGDVDAMILDITMPGMDGMEVLGRVRENSYGPEVVMLSASDSARLGIDAIRKGAFDYITKPFDAEDLLETVRRVMEKRSLEREVNYLRSEVEKLGGFGDIVGQSAAMQEVFRTLQKVSQTDSNVLITGESGTGKELIARAIHSRGNRSSGPFIPVNCAAIPQELLESEFFGHEKGSFTGAHERKVGKFELANKGILFLDEISTLKMALQAKLLRVLQEREFMRVGGSHTITVNVQVIAATNQDLRELAASGEFREDLYYRLNVLPIDIPPLRDRKNDIPLLVNHFLDEISYRLNRKVAGVTSEAMNALKAYPWPGNARELENLLERMVAFSSGDQPIGIEDLPVDISAQAGDLSGTSRPEGLIEARSRFERMYILSALKKSGGNQSEAARILDIHRNTLLKKLSSLKITLNR
jgi:DNA-binding NtrC family response regulator